MSRPQPAAVTCWAAINHINQLIPCTVRRQEANAIAEAEDYAGRPWRFLLDRGWRTAAVTITPGDNYATALLRADHSANPIRRRLGQ